MANTGQGWPMGGGSPYVSQGNDYEVNNKQYPGVILNPIATENNGIYSCIREINGSQWILQNADINAQGFYQIDGAIESNAFVQLAGGGLATYTAPAGSVPGFSWARRFYVDPNGILESPTLGSGELRLRFSGSSYTPSGDGPDGGSIIVIPWSPINDTTVVNWTVTDIFMRIENAGTSDTTVRVDYSVGAGAYTAAGFVDSAGITVPAGSNESARPTGIAQQVLPSGLKVRTNFTVVGNGIGGVSVYMTLKAPG